MRGSSGAEFKFLGDRVVKLAPDPSVGQRVMDQGLWLQKHHADGLPKVFQVYARSYVMERLITPPFWVLDHGVVLENMFSVLTLDVWSQPAVVEPDLEAIEIKYNDLCGRFDLQDVAHELDTLQVKIDWNALRGCLTHGDPTFDNVLFREASAELVIADPIPATPAIPDLRAVDLGKILQSALGWEEIRYNDRQYKFRAGTMDVQRRVTDKNEWRATIFFAAVHILRAFPYVTDDVRRKLKGRIDAAFHLGL